MSIYATLCLLAERGFSFAVRGERLHVEPVPDAVTIVELRAQKAQLLTYIAEQGGRWPIPREAWEHTYVAVNPIDRDADPNGGLCIACSTPWERHGWPPVEEWDLVDDPDSVQRIRACFTLIPPAVKRLCTGCGRIARLHYDGICVFCHAIKPKVKRDWRREAGDDGDLDNALEPLLFSEMIAKTEPAPRSAAHDPIAIDCTDGCEALSPRDESGQRGPVPF
jgi:hypothetical protein